MWRPPWFIAITASILPRAPVHINDFPTNAVVLPDTRQRGTLARLSRLSAWWELKEAWFNFFIVTFTNASPPLVSTTSLAIIESDPFNSRNFMG